MMCDNWRTRMFGGWKSCQKPIIVNQAWLRRGVVVLGHSIKSTMQIQEGTVQIFRFCCSLGLSQVGRELEVVFCGDLSRRSWLAMVGYDTADRGWEGEMSCSKSCCGALILLE